jgi:hypothetical protein
MFVAAYAALAGLVAVAAGGPAARPDPVRALLTAAVLAAGCGAAGCLAHLGGGLRGVPAVFADRLPTDRLVAVRGALRPALVALGVQLVAGIVLVAVMVAVRFDDVLAVHRDLEAGVVGGTVLVVGQLLAAPNLAVWGSAVLAGPGVRVGSGTSVSPAAVTLGELPDVPVLFALPAPGPMPAAALLLIAVPFAAGAVAGLLVVRRRGADAGRWVAAADTVLVGLLAGLGMAALGWLAGGGIGPGRLGVTGPAPLLVAAAFAAEVTVGALVTVGLGSLVARSAAGRLLSRLSSGLFGDRVSRRPAG